MVHQERSSASVFVMVTCSCGRGLRAKAELVGTEVRCWDCHKMVLVPMPAQGTRVARELSSNALTVINGPGLNSTLGASAVVTALLAVPEYGVLVAGVALAMAASAYGEIIRRVSLGPVDDPEPGWLETLLPRSLPKLALCVLLAGGTVIPLWWRHAGPMRSPHLDWAGRGVLAATWLLVPVLMLVLQGRTPSNEPMGFRRSLMVLARHPIATALALLAVPLTLVLLEVALGLLFYFPGNLPFFALDFMPQPHNPDPPVMYAGLPYYHLLDYRLFSDAIYYRGYQAGLRQGYTFVGGIPPSLSMSTRAGMDGEVIGLVWPFYLVLRVLIVLLIVTCLMAAFAIQARWLGSIAALERRKSVG